MLFLEEKCKLNVDSKLEYIYRRAIQKQLSSTLLFIIRLLNEREKKGAEGFFFDEVRIDFDVSIKFRSFMRALCQ